MKVKIRFDTYSEAILLSQIASRFPAEKITITDGAGLRANAKSTLGVLSTLEYDEIWLECEKDRFSAFHDFIVEE